VEICSIVAQAVLMIHLQNISAVLFVHPHPITHFIQDLRHLVHNTEVATTPQVVAVFQAAVVALKKIQPFLLQASVSAVVVVQAVLAAHAVAAVV